MGMCVNPPGSIIQVEGCLTMGMGYALSEDVAFKGGQVITRNFDTYQIPLFSWIPETIETVILERMDQPPQGGELPLSAWGSTPTRYSMHAFIVPMPMTPKGVEESGRWRLLIEQPTPAYIFSGIEYIEEIGQPRGNVKILDETPLQGFHRPRRVAARPASDAR
jgi:hypothetical protein